MFSRFAQLRRVPNTQTQTGRHTDHATFDICTDRLPPLRAGDAAQQAFKQVGWLVFNNAFNTI